VRAGRLSRAKEALRSAALHGCRHGLPTCTSAGSAVETVVPLQHGYFDGLAAGACDHERIIVLCPGPGEIGRQAGTDDGAENAAGGLAGAMLGSRPGALAMMTGR
jgi:hypothetical protein